MVVFHPIGDGVVLPATWSWGSTIGMGLDWSNPRTRPVSPLVVIFRPRWSFGFGQTPGQDDSIPGS